MLFSQPLASSTLAYPINIERPIHGTSRSTVVNKGASGIRVSHTRQALRALLAATACVVASAGATRATAQVIRGTVTSAITAQRVPGAVILLVDSGLATQARTLTTDSGTFVLGSARRGHFHLAVKRIGFRPVSSPTFELAGDTVIDLRILDLPIILTRMETIDSNRCRLFSGAQPDDNLRTAILWEQAHTALTATALTLERADYRFAKMLHVREYDGRTGQMRDIALRETEDAGLAPWDSNPVSRLERDGYGVETDSGFAIWAPDLGVLLSDYFTREHCFRLTRFAAPTPGLVGLDFEPARRQRHVEVRGTIWLDSATSELRSLRFFFVNLPVAAADTLFGGAEEFVRLSRSGWILTGWSLRVPTLTVDVRTTAYRAGYGPPTVTRRRARLSADVVHEAGGDVVAVRQHQTDRDTVLFRSPTGSLLVNTLIAERNAMRPGPGVAVTLTGSTMGTMSDERGRAQLDGLLPGAYLLEAATALHAALKNAPVRVPVVVRADQMTEVTVSIKPLSRAAAEACNERELSSNMGVLVGHILGGGSAGAQTKISLHWAGGKAEGQSDPDGYYSLCDVPQTTRLFFAATRDTLKADTTLMLSRGEVVHVMDVRMSP